MYICETNMCQLPLDSRSKNWIPQTSVIFSYKLSYESWEESKPLFSATPDRALKYKAISPAPL